MNIVIPPIIGLAPSFAIQITANICLAALLDAFGTFRAIDAARGAPSPLKLAGLLAAVAGAVAFAALKSAAPPADAAFEPVPSEAPEIELVDVDDVDAAPPWAPPAGLTDDASDDASPLRGADVNALPLRGADVDASPPRGAAEEDV